MKKLALIAGVVALAVAVPLIAFGGASGGVVNYHHPHMGNEFETKSDQWQTVDTITVSDAQPGAVIIRASGDAYAMDYGSGGVFKGEKYAAMKVRVRAGTDPLSVRTFADNLGALNVSKIKPLSNAAEWSTSLSGTFDVQLQIKSLNEKDRVGFTSYDMSVTYAKT